MYDERCENDDVSISPLLFFIACVGLGGMWGALLFFVIVFLWN